MEEKQETKNKGGRPRIKIDQSLFEKLCGIQCNQKEMESVLGCSADTIEKWCKRTYQDENGNPMLYRDVYQRFAGHGKVALRRYQLALAKKSASMAIWLGTQWLGQRDFRALQVTGANNGPIEVHEKKEVDLSALSAKEMIELVRTVFKNEQGSAEGTTEDSTGP